jgi:trehalose 6-phosphate synthase
MPMATSCAELEGLCGAINGDYGELDWMPVRYMHRTVARGAAGPVPRRRVGLVTPLRDGMNLVAKEYVVAQDPADPACWCCHASPARPNS